MRRKGAQSRAPVGLFAVFAAFAFGVTACAGAELGIRARETRALLKTARQSGAYQCAPRELALGETHVEFAERELDQGDYFRARDHLSIAESNARAAVQLSPKDRCLAQARPTSRKVADADRDGIPDATDKCIAEPEDKDGFEDEDGCPEADNDRDRILDAKDRCPSEPEDFDRFEDEDGCPDLDNDKDGVADPGDRCPVDPEDKDGFEDGDGCPDSDNDKDGVADALDKCPLDAGTADNDGCPKKYTYINVTPEKIELKQTIFFQTAKAAIMAKSYPLLDEVAAVMKTRASMRVRIEGHTDSRGSRNLNVRLSQARADSVRAYLMGHGVAGDRMEAKGFGPDQPIETNKTTAGRDKNRRVEFVITQQ